MQQGRLLRILRMGDSIMTSPTVTRRRTLPVGSYDATYCGEQTSLARYGYEVTGEVHANRDIEDVQVDFEEDRFLELGIWQWIYLGGRYSGNPSVTLGAIS